MKTSSELLTEESYLYIRTVIILGSSLGALTLAGLIWHFCFYKKTISPQPSDIGMKDEILLHLIIIEKVVVLSHCPAEYFLILQFLSVRLNCASHFQCRILLYLVIT